MNGKKTYRRQQFHNIFRLWIKHTWLIMCDVIIPPSIPSEYIPLFSK